MSTNGSGYVRQRDYLIRGVDSNIFYNCLCQYKLRNFFSKFQSDMVLAMSRINEVPPKNRLQEEAARLGYVARKGKSYLYQGHEWMPVGEADEDSYWAPPPEEEDEEEKHRRILADIHHYRSLKGSDADKPPEVSPALMEQLRHSKMEFTASSPHSEEDSPESEYPPQPETRWENINKFDAQSNASEQSVPGSLTEAELFEENKIGTSDSMNSFTPKELKITDKPYKDQALGEQMKNIKYSDINTNDVTQSDDNRFNEVSNTSDPHIITQ